MLSIATVVLCLALVFMYRAMHPALHPIPRIAKRVRVGIGLVIMVLSVSVGYLFPVEVGRGIERLENHQMQLQIERADRRMTSEQRHAERMIEIFGSADAYLTYLRSKNSEKSPF